MDTVGIVFDAEGKLVRPQGVRLRVPAEFVVRDEPEGSDEARAARIDAFFDETKKLLHDASRNDLRDDPRAAKYYRMGLLD